MNSVYFHLGKIIQLNLIYIDIEKQRQSLSNFVEAYVHMKYSQQWACGVPRKSHIEGLDSKDSLKNTA